MGEVTEEDTLHTLLVHEDVGRGGEAGGVVVLGKDSVLDRRG